MGCGKTKTNEGCIPQRVRSLHKSRLIVCLPACGAAFVAVPGLVSLGTLASAGVFFVFVLGSLYTNICRSPN